MTATLTPTEDQTFDAVWAVVSSLFDPTLQQYVFKGFQNMTATPAGVSYVVIQSGVVVRQNQGARSYDPVNGLQLVERGTTYSYQVDCYGPAGPDYANIIAIAWRSPWACDAMGAQAVDGPPLGQPLYADEPQQLNIVNGENMYEQRFMLKLYVDVNQVVALPQDFFTAVHTIVEPPADTLTP
jgi:hypothetical protein